MKPESVDTRRRSIDALDQAICRLSVRMDAACYEQLVLIREFDERAGWLEWSLPSCSDWLAWRCDISLSAAREKVRVAHALLQLPNISQAFAEGRLSYTKVRALTRVSHLRNEGELLRFACKHTAMQVEERCRQLRCGTVASTDAVNSVHERRYLSLRRDLERGTVSVTMEVSLEDGELIEKALDVARDSMARQNAERAGDSFSAQQADALVAVAQSYLEGGVNRHAQQRSSHLVAVHVDRSALVDERGRSGLPIESVRRIACDAETVTIVEDENEQPLSVGRQSRTVPKRILRALWAIRAARSPAATGRGSSMRTTSGTGRRAVKPASIISCSYARGITGRCMKGAFRSAKTSRTTGGSFAPTGLLYPSAVTSPAMSATGMPACHWPP